MTQISLTHGERDNIYLFNNYLIENFIGSRPHSSASQGPGEMGVDCLCRGHRRSAELPSNLQLSADQFMQERILLEARERPPGRIRWSLQRAGNYLCPHQPDIISVSSHQMSPRLKAVLDLLNNLKSRPRKIQILPSNITTSS